RQRRRHHPPQARRRRRHDARPDRLRHRSADVDRRRAMTRRLLFPCLAAFALSGCAGPVTSYKFPQRNYVPGEYAVDEATQNGLLWGEHTPNVIEDNRSRRLGDLVIVKIQEEADAQDSA